MSKYTPDQEPRTMITESQLADMLDRTYFQTKENALRFAFDLMGIKVVQDPKPPMTAVEEWIEERRAIQGSGVPFADRDSRAQFPRALDTLQAVLNLHQWRGYIDRDGTTVIEDCNECDTEYPCPTIQAIEGAING